MTSSLSLTQRATLIPALLFALYLLTDNDSTDLDDQMGFHRPHHLAVTTALNRHRPCLRVYRFLLEMNLVLWGAVISLALWKRTIGNKMIGYLLFQPANDNNVSSDDDGNEYNNNNVRDASSVQYLPVDADDIIVHHHHHHHHHQQDPDGKYDENFFDAHYESDGEVAAPLKLQPETYLDTTTSNDDVHKQDDVWEPPEVERVTAVALDSLIFILISLFLFTLSSAEGGRYVDGMANMTILQSLAFIAAPIFPLILFLGLTMACIFPWNTTQRERGRRGFWKILSFTMGAPMYPVTFRDGFLGDILTSSVRPLQDIAFTIFYILSGLQGWWKQTPVDFLDTVDGDLPESSMETNWVLHTVILPMCMASPLWWRFCQNLRQCYDAKQRWPYLGNALKYFIAAEVAMFGLFDPSRKDSWLWIISFVGATLYQIWWDVFMDWELLVIEFKKEEQKDCKSSEWWSWLLPPITIRLRDTRIYSVNWMYWTIFGINFVLRFCWTLSFLPSHYLNRAGVLSDTFESSSTSSNNQHRKMILNPTIASAEIIRRTLWGFLRVELEAIKVARKEPRLKGAWSDYHHHQQHQNQQLITTLQNQELQAMEIKGLERNLQYDPTSAGWITSDMYMLTEFQILGELCIYATIFTGLALVAAAHRNTQ